MATGAELAVRTLKAHGLKHVFGIPGVQNLEYFDAFASEGIEVVLVSHELAASFMADAVGRVTGEPGVVVVVPGPGLTNIFTGLAEALLDSAPVLALVPGIRSDLKESFQLHEINHEGAAQNLTKKYFCVDIAGEIPSTIARAIHAAKSGEPGPVIVEVPYNVLLEGSNKSPAEPLIPEYPVPSDEDIDIAARMILKSESPGLHVGMGAAFASAEVIELAERLDAPVSTTISGRGVIPEDHDLSVGFGFGTAGTPLAEKIFKGCDLAVAVGCKFSEVGSGSYGLKMRDLIHIDANPDVLGKNFPASLMIAGDAKRTIGALIERIRPVRPIIKSSKLRETIRADHETREKKLNELKPWKDAVNPIKLLHELRRIMPRDAILTTDSGAHTFFAIFAYDAYVPRSVLSPIDYSSMGYGVPAAIGASLAAPGRRVATIVGDGGMLMTGTEMATAKRLGLPLPIIVFNDMSLGLIKQVQVQAYRRATAVDLPNIDFEKFAAAFGFDYVLIEKDADIETKLRRAFEPARPVLVDARVEYRTLTRHTMGAARAQIKRTPPSVIMRSAARMALRTLFGVNKSEEGK